MASKRLWARDIRIAMALKKSEKQWQFWRLDIDSWLVYGT